MLEDKTSQHDDNLPKNIILVGFMGCGKSTIGRQVSLQLNYPLIDTDHLIEEKTGKTIPQIFKEHGEQHFRDLETELLTSLITSDAQRSVISTGGGLPLREENRELLKKLGFVVWLQASANCIFDRTSCSDNRPLLKTANPKETIKSMLADREVIYRDSSELIINTDDLTVSDTTHGIIESARYYFSHY